MIYIKIYLLGWFITNFEPIQDLLNMLFKKLFKKLPCNLKRTYFYLIDSIFTTLGCQKCMSFWLGFIFIDFYSGILLSFISMIQGFIINGKK